MTPQRRLFPMLMATAFAQWERWAEQLLVTNQVFRDYNYVPGLQGDDPKDLVLLYFNKLTRWRSHVQDAPTVWTPKSWVVVPADPFAIAYGEIGTGPHQVIGYGEQSESLTTEQFTNRLIGTLNFLRTNNRPHWQTVVKEHTAFLQSLPR